jgi:hypothetical protein
MYAFDLRHSSLHLGVSIMIATDCHNARTRAYDPIQYACGIAHGGKISISIKEVSCDDKNPGATLGAKIRKPLK